MDSRKITMLGLADALEQLERAGKSGLVLFVGAGISVEAPSSCPAWNQLLNMVVSASEEAHPRASRLRQHLGSALSRIKPEMFCQTMYDNLLAEGIFGFLDVLYLGLPNRNHRAIAELTGRMSIPLILTTNFDTHIEAALDGAQIESDLHVGRFPRRALDALGKQPTSRRRVTVLKIHGSLEDRTSIVITMRQAGRSLNKDLAEVIKRAFVSSPVLIVGYSGNDDDIFPAMLSIAGQAQEVYWALWGNEKSITANIQLFAEACPNCKLVRCESRPILAELAGGSVDALKDQPSISATDAATYLKKWMSGTPEYCWINVFAELLLKTACDEDAKRAVVEESDRIRRTTNDKLLLARSCANYGLAMARLKQHDEAAKVLLEAAGHFLVIAHHQEVVECLSQIVTETPLQPQWHGKTLPHWCADLAGRNYDPYQMAMYNLVAGITFLQGAGDERRMRHARNYLLCGAGYARKCGDSVLLTKCLEHLANFFRLRNCPREEKECITEVARLKVLLGMLPPRPITPEGSILRECDLAMRNSLRKSVFGEAVIVLAIAGVLGLIMMLFDLKPVHRVLNFVGLVGLGAGVKVWNVKKASLKYRHIERS